MRLRADMFVSALIRRVEVAGAVAMLRRRGAAEAGAVFVTLDKLDGQAALYAPAPQSEAGDDGMRRFVRAHKEDWLSPPEIETRLKREINFDSDIWILEIEDRLGRDFLTYGASHLT